jgi:hypothetical protein
MDGRLRNIELTNGVFTRAEILDLGYDDRFIRQALQARMITRVRHGAYCFSDTWQTAEAVSRHLIHARAVMRSLGGRVVLSHTTALLAQGVSLWGADLTRVHVTRVDGASGHVNKDVIHHEGLLDDSEIVSIDGMLMTTGARAVLEAGTVQGTESAIVSTDSALRAGVTTSEKLAAQLAAMERWPFTQHLQLVLRLADARAESPGESRSRYLFWLCGLPAPDLQVEVRDDRGWLVGVTDFGWRKHGVLGEFDGKVKYGRLLKPGQQPGDAVFAEKRREDRLREVTGFSVFRLTWSDLSTPAGTGTRLARLLGVAAA